MRGVLIGIMFLLAGVLLGKGEFATGLSIMAVAYYIMDGGERNGTR